MLLVEGVDAFYDDGAVAVNLDGFACLSLTCLEIEIRQCDFFTIDKVIKVLVELLYIKAVDMFKVKLFKGNALNLAYLLFGKIIVIH